MNLRPSGYEGGFRLQTRSITGFLALFAPQNRENPKVISSPLLLILSCSGSVCGSAENVGRFSGSKIGTHKQGKGLLPFFCTAEQSVIRLKAFLLSTMPADSLEHPLYSHCLTICSSKKFKTFTLSSVTTSLERYLSIGKACVISMDISGKSSCTLRATSARKYRSSGSMISVI